MSTYYFEAVELARVKHLGQTDKAGRDYFDHVSEVARIVREELGGDVKAAAIAFLHDIVEDTDVTVDYLREHFDDEISEAVDVLSRKPGDTYAQFIDKVLAHGGRAAVVKQADIIDHLADTSAIPQSLVDRYTKALARFVARDA